MGKYVYQDGSKLICVDDKTGKRYVLELKETKLDSEHDTLMLIKALKGEIPVLELK